MRREHLSFSLRYSSISRFSLLLSSRGRDVLPCDGFEANKGDLRCRSLSCKPRGYCWITGCNWSTGDWLFFKGISAATYKVLRRAELHKPPFFAVLKKEHLEKLSVKPFGQVVMLQEIVESFQIGQMQSQSGGQSGKAL